MTRHPPSPTPLSLHDALPILPQHLRAYRDRLVGDRHDVLGAPEAVDHVDVHAGPLRDRKSTRLNSSHMSISYAVFCLKKKKGHEILNGRPVGNPGAIGPAHRF